MMLLLVCSSSLSCQLFWLFRLSPLRHYFSTPEGEFNEKEEEEEEYNKNNNDNDNDDNNENQRLHYSIASDIYSFTSPTMSNIPEMEPDEPVETKPFKFVTGESNPVPPWMVLLLRRCPFFFTQLIE